ncbi:DMT family transporter [Dongia rigui]|uniref:DMT family transporter n=1 Tax=Dongia rigui TaxID=940149 RepID=A0ABU5DX40_9PROT|nr:DMT family transporter [Dongia rigui]MDY0871857.1 DMT family transporter [Dongia rigui]
MSERGLPAERPAGDNATTGIVLLVLITLFWGVNWPAIKLSVNEVPVWAFRTICLLAGAGGLFAIAAAAKLPLRIPRQDLRPLLIAALGNITGWHLFSALGVMHMQPGRASILAFTMPLWAAPIAALWLKEKIDGLRLAGLGVGMIGLLVLVVPDLANISAAPLGPVFMLLAAISWAFGTVALKTHCYGMPTTSLVAWQMLLGGLPIFIGAALFDGSFDPSAVSALGWGAVAYAALIPMIFCHWAWFRVVGIYPAVVAAIGTLAIPVVGIISSALITGDAVGWDEILSLALVVLALFLVLVAPQLRRRT